MSKSLGNSPEPLDLIKQYSADGVRVGMLLCSPAGGDLLYDDSLPEQGRNFGNKIWNAFRLIRQWEVDHGIEQPASARAAIEWFENKLNQTLAELEGHYAKYRISDALMTLYRLFWDEFSAWYLESIKPPYGKPIDAATQEKTNHFLDMLIRMLHPFMPFITEHVWQLMAPREEGESIMLCPAPSAGKADRVIISAFEDLKEAVSAIRNIRKEKSLPAREGLRLFVRDQNHSYDRRFESILVKLGILDHLEETTEKMEAAVSFRVNSAEFYVPLESAVDAGEELQKLQDELSYTRGFLKAVLAKLGNARFVENAPEQVVKKERKKKEDAEKKIQVLEERIRGLRG
jgi:valyl-tRNA synthetase